MVRQERLSPVQAARAPRDGEGPLWHDAWDHIQQWTVRVWGKLGFRKHAMRDDMLHSLLGRQVRRRSEGGVGEEGWSEGEKEEERRREERRREKRREKREKKEKKE